MNTNQIKTDKVVERMLNNRTGAGTDPWLNPSGLSQSLQLSVLHTLVLLDKMLTVIKACLDLVGGDRAGILVRKHAHEKFNAQKDQEVANLQMRLIHLTIFRQDQIDEIITAFKEDLELLKPIN